MNTTYSKYVLFRHESLFLADIPAASSIPANTHRENVNQNVPIPCIINEEEAFQYLEMEITTRPKETAFQNKAKVIITSTFSQYQR